tara:strand:- start:201 stop:950 length:750 start_codon:yes stop_codon:yes gene_type:complete
MNNPYISIIITYYKKRNFISKTLKAIKKQTYKNYELIFVYDDSNLIDLKYVKKLIANFKNYKIIINKKNYGVSYSRNIGIKFAKGSYIAFIDSDDIWENKKLSTQLKIMNKAKADVSYTSYKIIDEDDKIIGTREVSSEINYKKLLRYCEIGLSTVIIKKKFLKKNKFPDIKTQEDFALWLVLIKKELKFLPIKKLLSSWRRTENSLSTNVLQKISDAFKVYYSIEKKNLIISIISVLILSINKLKNYK